MKNNNEGERITLRLEPEDLELIDTYIEKHSKFSSRSHLARIAIRSMIEGEQRAEEKAVEPPQKPNRITIELPMAVFTVIEGHIKLGNYTSFNSAIEEITRAYFLNKDKITQTSHELAEDSYKAAARM